MPVLAALGFARSARRAPDDGRDPRHELADAEGLRQVVVRAAVKADDLVEFGVASRQHEHAGSLVRTARPQRAAHGDTVHAGEHDVQHDQVEPIGTQALQRRASIRDLFGLEPRQREMQADDLPDRRFIFDDQRSPRGGSLARPCGQL